MLLQEADDFNVTIIFQRAVQCGPAQQGHRGYYSQRAVQFYLTSLSPSSVPVGASSQTLTINGGGFLGSSVVTFNGAAHQAAFISGEYRIVQGQLKRSQKFLAIRGLNANHNHDLKNIFKGAATRAAAVPGPSKSSTPV